MKLLVTGKTGQVASSLRQVGAMQGVDMVFVGRPQYDLTSSQPVNEIINDIKPDLVISAAAYTAVDKAESEKDVAMVSNGMAPRLLSRACYQAGIPIIHLSTDYVFDGSKREAYVETDDVGPINVYGASKLAGEQAIREETENYAILRTAWVYSAVGNNFVKTMLRLASREEVRVVADTKGNPTSALEIANCILDVAEKLLDDKDPRMRGLFHMAGSGDASWADLAEAVFAAVPEGSANARVARIQSSEYPTAARRPQNSTMNCGRLLSVFGRQLPPWQDSLRVVVDQIFDNDSALRG